MDNPFGQASAMRIPTNSGAASSANGSEPININISMTHQQHNFNHSHNQQYQQGNSRRNSIHPKLRRDSIAHSQGMGGVSWGSVAIGSWLKDDVLNLAVYNQAPNHQFSTNHAMFTSNMTTSSSPSIQNTGYMANLEADYCKDYSCCGQLLPTLHDLLRHYEEMHIQPSPPEMETPRSKAVNSILDTVSTNEVFLSHQGMEPQFQVPEFDFAVTNNFQNQHSETSGVDDPTPKTQPGATVGSGPHSQIRQGQHQQQQFPMDEDEDTEMCIDDPARHLYVSEHSEHRPFKCPVVGCDKTYKNQNGLKYHRLHGHQNQKLHPNEDGTFSVIDPESNAPYPDGLGLERDKPYRCEVCGKRYKNLNGLKYHRGHSTH
ncbi:BA75_03144T0 [Komagataella pastoris]|uniref:BA75_03144T0 n=1 Tax=Komagataella pastoris TaxID=4922 RepID=A0A1B2JCI8_PICPA|nr:BA75_03144T0 [Komagataella pastoris]